MRRVQRRRIGPTPQPSVDLARVACSSPAGERSGEGSAPPSTLDDDYFGAAGICSPRSTAGRATKAASTRATFLNSSKPTSSRAS